MNNSKCIYSKAFYYSFVYMVIILASFVVGFVNNAMSWNFETLNVVGFGALVIPTIPFQGLLFKYNLMLNAGWLSIPSDMGLLLAHSIWVLFFYVSYLSYLLLKRKYCPHAK